MEFKELWESALGEIEIQVSRPNFITWFRNSQLLDKKEGAALIGFPNNFAKEWVENKYSKIVLGAIRNIDETTKKVEFIVHNNPNITPKINEPKTRKPLSANQQIFSELRVDPETNLNPRYSLNSYVVGSANE